MDWKLQHLLTQGNAPVGTWPYALAVAVVAAMLSSYAMPILIRMARARGLNDHPDEERKQHRNITPILGGFGIFAALIVTFGAMGHARSLEGFPVFASGLAILFFVGVKDDLMKVNPGKKLFAQVLAGALLIWGGVYIPGMGGLFGVQSLPFWAGAMLTLFTVIVVINAYNLIDGIDGLAGGIGIIASLAFGSWFWYHGAVPEALLGFALAGALFGFLRFNFEPARIFMGDTGSMVVGYALAFLTIRFLKFNGGTVADGVHATAPVFALAVLVVPLYDTLRVFILRAVNGKSPMDAGREHVHHELLELGLGHRLTALTLYGINILFIGLAWSLRFVEIHALLAINVTVALLLFPTFQVKRRMFNWMHAKVLAWRGRAGYENESGVVEDFTLFNIKQSGNNGLNDGPASTPENGRHQRNGFRNREREHQSA